MAYLVASAKLIYTKNRKPTSHKIQADVPRFMRGIQATRGTSGSHGQAAERRNG